MPHNSEVAPKNLRGGTPGWLGTCSSSLPVWWGCQGAALCSEVKLTQGRDVGSWVWETELGNGRGKPRKWKICHKKSCLPNVKSIRAAKEAL